MIYLVKEFTDMTDDYIVTQVFDIDCEDVNKAYLGFLLEEATSLGIIINIQWGNIMSFESFHEHLTEHKYKNLSKKGAKFTSKHTRLWFIKNKLNYKKIEYNVIYS